MENLFNQTLSVLPIRNTVLFPGVTLPFRVARPGSIAALEKAKGQERDGSSFIFLVTQRNDEASPEMADLYSIGTLAKIEKIREADRTGFQAVVQGVGRYRLYNYQKKEGSIFFDGEPMPDVLDVDPATYKALLESIKGISKEILDLIPADTKQLNELVDGIGDLSYLCHLCASHLELSFKKKQEILETVSLKSRSLMLLDILQQLKNSLKVQNEIRDKLSDKVGKLQREALLREQLKTIRDELGEGENLSESQENYRKRIDDAGMPEEVKKTALEQLKRMELVGNSSPETHVIRNYLDLLCAMPWSKSAPEIAESLDLDEARRVLDQEHSGLTHVKKRILQHLALMKLKKGIRGSILLLVGPPGVGKTSLGQSIAHVLGRKFVRGSLGGVRDDAEIRGHRRTYIGAMPGRIVQGIKRAGENNPVFMLDEIDKLSHSFQGDPASALLEVLDPEQNSTFLDHYLDVPFDLSKVFFIATANTLETIPGPLLDRMEVIDLNGYTTPEKLHIAKNHLISKQLSEHGLNETQLQFSDEALLRMITHYTREAGVRDLQRKIAAVCRGSAENILKPDAKLPLVITVQNLEEILGPEKYMHEVVERIVPPGVVTGLAWTPQGGEILFIEAASMPGHGKLILTGQLGEVMKESAHIALSLVRSRLAHRVPEFDYEKRDIHIHIPAGATPKDGPSAGITLMTTIASLFLGKSVSPKLAMTGEITLRGAVMPVGGVKEKVIAAHRAGIERVIMSKRNQKDLTDVPEEVRSQMRFDFVDTVSEVLKIALDMDMDLDSLSVTSAVA